MEEKKYYYSEIFYSIQGEGHYTGVPTAWIRFFLCNLQCNGFGQIDPTNPDTYELPFEDFDVDSVKRVEDLPVWEKGCDSSYTWAKKFKKLMGYETPTVLANKIVKGIFPILKKTNNFYYYNFAKGKTLYEVKKQTKIFNDFLKWADNNLWIKKKKDKGFKINCVNFYKDKTYLRLKKILKKHNGIDKLRINNKHINSIRNLLNKLNWNKITTGDSYFIHGDLQFDNILHTGYKSFILLDWRQSFGNYVDKGDIYYDISKLLGGLLINY